MRTLTIEEASSKCLAAGKVFQPRTPIAVKELLAGRWSELTTLVDSVAQQGLHVVVYGERGVGKTSLANVVQTTIHVFDKHQNRIVVKINADSDDTFSSIWKKLFVDITWEDARPTIGLNQRQRDRVYLSEAFNLPDQLSIEDVRRALISLPESVFIIDEFDRAPMSVSKNFTDLIKSLSDFAVDSTIILVGVSDTVDQLVADHASINRSVVQIPLQRLTADSLKAILFNAEKSLDVEFSSEAKNLIVHISQGLPHYTHLIGMHSVRKAAMESLSNQIGRAEVFNALREAVKQAQQTVTEKHIKAVHSAHKDALYRQVLLACAMAAARSHDALGYFNPSAVVSPLESVLGRKVEIATFNNHLAEFCQIKRGHALERTGESRGFRYRFRDPLLVPFVFMDALATNLTTDEELSQRLGGSF